MKRIVLTLGLLAAVNCAAMADGNAFTPLNFLQLLLLKVMLLATAIFKMLFYSLTMLKLTFAMIC